MLHNPGVLCVRIVSRRQEKGCYTCPGAAAPLPSWTSSMERTSFWTRTGASCCHCHQNQGWIETRHMLALPCRSPCSCFSHSSEVSWTSKSLMIVKTLPSSSSRLHSMLAPHDTRIMSPSQIRMKSILVFRRLLSVTFHGYTRLVICLNKNLIIS